MDNQMEAVGANRQFDELQEAIKKKGKIKLELTKKFTIAGQEAYRNQIKYIENLQRTLALNG